MKSLKMMIVIAAAGAVLAATPGYAQGAATPQQPATPPAAPKPTPPPAGQPPATPPAAAQPAPQPQPPRPFPEGAKFAFVDIQAVASLSAEGKSATAKIQEWEKRKNAELLSKSTQLKALQDKLSSGSSVMSDPARTQLEKDIEKGQRDLQFAQQDAQTERNEMTQQLQAEFQDKLNPILEQVRAEKGLLIIFSVRDAGIVAVDLGLDLSNEVVKRFDAAAKTAPKK
jgi:Skp family chaperone for outer membrane proteins